MTATVFVDTNVFIYYLDRTNLTKHGRGATLAGGVVEGPQGKNQFSGFAGTLFKRHSKMACLAG